MRVELPYSFDIPLKSYAFFSNYLGALVGYGYDIKGVLYNKFTTLVFDGRLDYVMFLGFPIKKTLVRQFDLKTVTDLTEDPIAFVKECIDHNQYSEHMLNAKFLSNVSFDRDWFHEWMIHGYDDEQKIFLAVGYEVDTTCHAFTLKPVTISFDDFLRALPSRNENKTTRIFSLPNNYVSESVNVRKIRFHILLYAYNLLPLVFNARIYRKYAFIFRLKHRNTKQFGLGSFQIMHEHKLLIHQMMNELAPGSEAAQTFQNIVNLANTIKVTALKYNITKRNKQKAIDIICEALEKLRVEEPRVMRLFYRELKGSPKP